MPNTAMSGSMCASPDRGQVSNTGGRPAGRGGLVRGTETCHVPTGLSLGIQSETQLATVMVAQKARVKGVCQDLVGDERIELPTSSV